MKKILSFLILFHIIGNAQIPLSKDSLLVFLKTKPKDTTYVLALNEYAFLQIQEGNYDDAGKTIQQMDVISRKLNYGTGFYKTTNIKGVIEYSRQNSEKAMQYFLLCNDIIKKYRLEKQYYQNSLNNISIIYNQLGDRDNATKYALELIDFQEKNKLNPLKTSPYDQIGRNLKFYKKYDEALVYFKKALSIETQYQNLTGMSIGENNIGTVYEDMKRNKEAIFHYKKGLQYAEKTDYKFLQTDLLINLGQLYLNDDNLKLAEGYLLRSEKICRELDIKKSLSIACQGLGDLYNKKNDKKLALKYYLESYSIVKNVQDPKLIYSINNILSQFYYKNGDYKRAYLHQLESQSARDSLFKTETLENTENLLRKYEADKKQQTIKILSAENAVKNLKIKTANKQKLYFIYGSLFLTIIGGVLFYQNRQRKKTNSKLRLLNNELDKSNKVKAMFLAILNHDLRSPLSKLISLLNLQKKSPELLDEPTKEKLDSQVRISAEQLLNQMENLLFWAKTQMKNFTPEKKYFSGSEIFSELKNEFIWVENIDINFSFSENQMFFSDKEYLKTILRNIIANAVNILQSKKNAKISVSSFETEYTHIISIRDNGGGADPEKFKMLFSDMENIGNKNGLGLYLIKDLARAITVKVSINTGTGMDETEFILQINKDL